MSEQQHTLWHIVLEQEDGQVQAHAEALDHEQLQGGLLNEIHMPTTLVHIPQGTVLDTVITSGEDGVPARVLKTQDTALQATDEMTTIWACLVFCMPKTEGTFPDKAEQNQRQASDLITVNQRRFLFRLLAQRNITGQKAENYLKKALEVDDISDASKQEASDLIGRLKDQGGDGF